MDSNKNFNAVVDFLRVLLTVQVVFVHVISFGSLDISNEISWDNLYKFLATIISHGTGRVAVPAFFMISGYFYFANINKYGGYNWEFYKSKQKNRFKTLVIPYFIINTIAILFTFLKLNVFAYFNINDSGVSEMEFFRNSNIIDWYWNMPIDFPLWFLRDLIVTTHISFIFYYLFKYTRFVGLLFLVAIHLMELRFQIYGFSTISMLFFGLGAYISLYKIDVMGLILKPFSKTIILTAFVVLILMTSYYEGKQFYYIDIVQRVYPILGVFALLIIGNYLMRKQLVNNVNSMLKRYTFFIYGIHSIYIMSWVKGACYRTPLANSGWGMIILYFVIPVIVILICIVIYKIMERLTPRTLELICGSR